jgi:hypothetical protein
LANAHSQAAWEAGKKAKLETKRCCDLGIFLKIDPKLFAFLYFLGPRYGQSTSNIVKSANSLLQFDRELPNVQLLDIIWHKYMELRSAQKASALSWQSKGMELTPYS